MTSPSYQQRVSRTSDQAVLNARVHRAQLKLDELEQTCNADEAQIRAAETRFEALPAHDRGWAIEVVAILAVISIALEIYPAHLMSLVFFGANGPELGLLTAAFAGGGFLLGLVLGEMARRYRVPQRHTLIDHLCFVFALIAVIAFLAVGFELRMGYAAASTDSTNPAIGPLVQAAALTTLAFIGIVVAFTAGYHRESYGTVALRYRLINLRSNLKSSETQLQATRHEFAAADRAASTSADGMPAPRVQTIASDGAYGNGNGSSNGVSGNGLLH